MIFGRIFKQVLILLQGRRNLIRFRTSSIVEGRRAIKKRSVEVMGKLGKRIMACLSASLVVMSLAGCSVGGGGNGGDKKSVAGSLKGKNVRVVIGSTSTSGDSYMMADLVTRYLSKKMGFKGKVDAIGNSAALDTISKAKGDGTTVMMFHDMTFLSVLFGSVDKKYALENLTVGPRIGQNPGGCFGAAKDAPYKSLSEVTKYLKANPDKTVSFNIESGATSHLAFVAYYLDVKRKEGDAVASRIKAIVGGTTADKLQRLWDRNADVIYGDTSAFEQYTKDGVDAKLAMNMFDSCGKVNGLKINSMAEDGIEFEGKPFDFAKDFAMYFPKNMDEKVLKEYEAAMVEIVKDPQFQKDMAALYYNTLKPEEVTLQASKDFIYGKRKMCESLIKQAPALDTLPSH